MTPEALDPLEERAANLRRMTPHLIADVRLYTTGMGGKKQAAPPGWGCPCMVSKKQPLSGFDCYPVLNEPLHPGENREGVGFVFLSPEGAQAMSQAGHFYLWEGGFIGEAFVVS